MNLIGVMDVSASALKEERVRAEVVASNMANAETTRTADGGPYQRHHVVFEAEGGGSFQQAMARQMGGLSGGVTDAKAVPGGVSVTGVISDAGAPLPRYDPHLPDARPHRSVAYPRI